MISERHSPEMPPRYPIGRLCFNVALPLSDGEAFYAFEGVAEHVGYHFLRRVHGLLLKRVITICGPAASALDDIIGARRIMRELEPVTAAR